MKLLALTRYTRKGASSRLRLYQYLPHLHAHGIETHTAPLLPDAYLENAYAGRPKRLPVVARAYLHRLWELTRARRYDLLWIEYELFPWLPAWAEATLTRLGVPYVVDYDDAIFHYYDRAPRPLRQKIAQVMQRAALVTVGNGYLADYARTAGARRIAHLPTVIDLERYPLGDKQKGAERIRKSPLPQGERGFRGEGNTARKVTLGWIGSPTTAKYLHSIAPVLSESGARLLLIGAGPIELPGTQTEHRAWSEDTEAADLQDIDIGIMPLPDEPWTRGKCGYKLIQYMASARPVIASPVGANREIVEHGVNGYLADTPAEWRDAINRLTDDPDLRARMGQAGRARVEAEYSLQVSAPKLLSLLREI